MSAATSISGARRRQLHPDSCLEDRAQPGTIRMAENHLCAPSPDASYPTDTVFCLLIGAAHESLVNG